MSEMKLIMENWNNYSKAQKLAEDSDYVHNFLGVSPLLLESSRNEYYRQILVEQQLYEGLLDSIKNFIKSKTGPAKQLGKVILLSLKDQTNAKKFIELVKKKVFDPANKQLAAIFSKLKLTSIYNAINEKILTPLRNIKSLVKQVLAITTAAVILTELFEKIKPFISAQGAIDKLIGDAGGKVEDFVLELLKGTGAAVEAAAESEGFKDWLANTAGSVAGGVIKVSDILEPATTAFFAGAAGLGLKGRQKKTAAQKKKAQQKASKLARKRNR